MVNLLGYLQFRGLFTIYGLVLCFLYVLFIICTILLQHIANCFAMDDWGVPTLLTLSQSHTRAFCFWHRS